MFEEFASRGLRGGPLLRSCKTRCGAKSVCFYVVSGAGRDSAPAEGGRGEVNLPPETGSEHADEGRRILGLLGDVLARLGARKPEIIKNQCFFFQVSGGSQERLGASWERLGASFGRLGGAWGCLGGGLGAS